MKRRIKASPARLAQLRGTLLDWAEGADEDADPGEDAVEAAALIAFYPLRTEPGATGDCKRGG